MTKIGRRQIDKIDVGMVKGIDHCSYYLVGLLLSVTNFPDRRLKVQHCNQIFKLHILLFFFR